MPLGLSYSQTPRLRPKERNGNKKDTLLFKQIKESGVIWTITTLPGVKQMAFENRNNSEANLWVFQTSFYRNR